MKCIEEKMRMDLHFQGFQLRLHELRAKLRSLQLAFAITVVITERVAHTDDDPVKEHPFVEVVIGGVEDSAPGNTARPSHENHVEEKMSHDQRAAQKDAYAEVKSRSSSPIVTFDTVSPGKPEDEWRRERPKIAAQGLEEKIAKADWLPFSGIHHVDLGTKEECDNRPHSPDQSVTHQPSGQYWVCVIHDRIAHFRCGAGHGRYLAMQSRAYSVLVTYEGRSL